MVYPQSLDQSLYMLNTFPECAGLRVNLVKTEAIWLGSRWSCHEHKHLSWNFSGKFKLLGITFNLSESEKKNFTEKVQLVKKILSLWSYRNLTYIGKVTPIKTLALPILVQCLTVLPNPPDSILNDIEKIFYKFLYGMVKRTRSRDPLLSMNMKKGEIFNPFTKHLKCHGFINYLTLSIIHHGKYFYWVLCKNGEEVIYYI